jgi:hypothetical protein
MRWFERPALTSMVYLGLGSGDDLEHATELCALKVPSPFRSTNPPADFRSPRRCLKDCRTQGPATKRHTLSGGSIPPGFCAPHSPYNRCASAHSFSNPKCLVTNDVTMKVPLVVALMSAVISRSG